MRRRIVIEIDTDVSARAWTVACAIANDILRDREPCDYVERSTGTMAMRFRAVVEEDGTIVVTHEPASYDEVKARLDDGA